MKTYVKFNRIKMLLVCSLILMTFAVNAQMSYEEFHAKYVPHYQTITPDLKAVEVTNESDAETGALIVQLLMEQYEGGDEESQTKLLGILSSCKREVVAAILKELDVADAVKFLNIINDEWQREIMFFVDKTTYHNLAPYLTAIAYWPGPEGPFGPQIKGFMPAYAGIALDFGYGGYRGINKYIEAYNYWPQKGNAPVYFIDTPISELHTSIGFAAFGAFYLKGKGFLQIDFQNRTAKGSGGGTVPEIWTKDFKFTSNTFGIQFLKSKAEGNKKIRFAQGWGMVFQMGHVSERNSVTVPDWENIYKSSATTSRSFNVGVTYNVGIFINPFKKIPLVFGLKAYVQGNILKYDMGYLETYNPQTPWASGTVAIEDMKSGMSTIGAQFQVMYKFGKVGDDKIYTDFDTELAQNMDKHVNTTYTEILPIISPDGKTLYFIRQDHPMNTGGSIGSQNVWVADVSNGVDNATATHLTKIPFNPEEYNMIAGVSPDGNSMLIKGIFDESGEYIKLGYSMIVRTKNGWSKPVALDIDSYEEMALGNYIGAYWTQDGKHILLSFSEVKNDYSQDLYVTHLQPDGTWSKPASLGTTINSSATNDTSPFLASDGKTLYFSSDREGTLGSNDIWMTKLEDSTWTKWSTPVNLGPEVNTEGWDAYYSLDAQGKFAYMASETNSKGREDIIRIPLKEEVQPDPVVLISGKVLNKKTNEPLDATISYNGLIDGKNYGVARTNPATGEYTIILPYGVNYDFTASAVGFMGISENLDLTSVGEYQEIKRDLYLVPIEVGATVRLNNIFFETGKAELKTESYAELNRVITFLKENPNVKIELSGHTDNVGNDEFNKSLSQKRADSVLAYLTANGIDVARLTAKGYGMEKPVADNTTEQGKALNRRVEFTILSN